MNKNDNIYKSLISKGLTGKQLEKAYREKKLELLKSLDTIVDNIDDKKLIENCKEGKCKSSSDF